MSDEAKMILALVVFTILSGLAINGLFDNGWQPCMTTRGLQMCAPR